MYIIYVATYCKPLAFSSSRACERENTPNQQTLGHAMEARDAALAAVRADGLELRKVGEFRADKDEQLASSCFMETTSRLDIGGCPTLGRHFRF
jgi:hypothetical protein